MVQKAAKDQLVGDALLAPAYKFDSDSGICRLVSTAPARAARVRPVCRVSMDINHQ